MKNFALLAMLLALISGCDHDLLIIEAEAREVCLSGVRIEVPASPTSTMTEVAIDKVAEAAPLVLPEGSRAVARLLGVGVVLTDGPDDFAFVETLRLEMAGADPDGPLPSIPLVDAANLAEQPVLFFEADGDTDLIEYLRQDVLAFGVNLRGELPAEDWALELDLCFHLELEYRY